MDDQARGEVLAAYAAYLTAFRANDVDALDRLMLYPLAYIGDGGATLVDTCPFNPIPQNFGFSRELSIRRDRRHKREAILDVDPAGGARVSSLDD